MDGNAIVYCEGAFGSSEGKIAHALVRYSKRYRVAAIIDSRAANQDAGKILDGKDAGIPVVSSLEEAMKSAVNTGKPATHFVIAVEPQAGMTRVLRDHILEAMRAGLHVDSGLRNFIADDEELVNVAASKRVNFRDVRKPRDETDLPFYDGRKLDRCRALKIGVFGTDHAVGKQTTARSIVQQLEDYGRRVSLIGTSVTSWMQGYHHSVIIDSLPHQYVHGAIEETVSEAWERDMPYAMVIEGHGSLMNPDQPGGFDVLAAARPDVIILQHLPKPRRKLVVKPRPLKDHIHAVELLSGAPVAAIALNHEGLSQEELQVALKLVKANTGIPAFDVLHQGAGGMLKAIDTLIQAA